MKLSRYLKKIGEDYYNFVDFFHITTAPDGKLIISWIICIPFLVLTIIKHDEKMLGFFSCFLILIIIIPIPILRNMVFGRKLEKNIQNNLPDTLL